MSYREGPELNSNDFAFLQQCLASRRIDPASGEAEAASLFRAHLCGIVEKADLYFDGFDGSVKRPRKTSFLNQFARFRSLPEELCAPGLWIA